MVLCTIPDDVLHHVMLFLTAQDTCRLTSTCTHIGRVIDASKQWKTLCDRDFKDFPRYNCETNGYPNTCYKVSYRHIIAEVQRTTINPADLEFLNWYFNFSPAAGGRGKATLVECSFIDGCLILDEYPPLPYYIIDESRSVNIAYFPPHDVSRLPDGEWLIRNENVAMVSFGPGRRSEFNHWGYVHC